MFADHLAELGIALPQDAFDRTPPGSMGKRR